MFKSKPWSRPSLDILESLYEHDDFMGSVQTLVDLGCGSGEDLIWWATATTRDESPQPLNIRCVGVDILDQLPVAKKYNNMSYQPTDFETVVHAPKEKFDVLWCHDAFQYCVNPINTLALWRDIASVGAMLIIAVPQTMQFSKNKLNFYLPSGSLYHYSLVSLIYMLSLTGWDCKNGFFQHQTYDGWIRAVVYNTEEPIRDTKKTTWYDLLDTELLPDSAKKSIMAHGYLRHQDLVVPWLDHNLTWLGKQ